MNKFWVIVSNVYKKNVKTVSFWIMLLVPFIMAGVVYAVGYFASGAFDDANKIAFVSEDKTIATAAKQALSTDELTVKVYTDAAQAKKDLSAEKIDGYLVVTVKDTAVRAKLTSSKDLGTTTTMGLSSFLTQYQQSLQMGKLGLTAADVAELSKPAEFTTEKVKIEDGKEVQDHSDTGLKFGVSFVLVIMIFMMIMTYGSIIGQEVASEKGTRIMEVILSSTTAQTHFYGKITGVLLVALTQFGAYIVAGVIGWPLIKNQEFVKSFLEGFDLASLFGSFLLYNMVFFFLGIMIFSVLAALCGSLVNKAEDVSKAIIPVTYLALAGYLIGISIGTGNPQSIVVRIASFVPFFSSFTMPVRIAADTAATGEIWLSIGILLAAVIALTIFSAQMYKANVLVYSEGGFIKSIKQSFSIMRNEKKKA